MTLRHININIYVLMHKKILKIEVTSACKRVLLQSNVTSALKSLCFFKSGCRKQREEVKEDISREASSSNSALRFWKMEAVGLEPTNMGGQS